MGAWAIVQGATGHLCVVPQAMASEHLTHGREVYVPISADGLISAIGKLHEYEANTRAPILSESELKKLEESGEED